MNISHVHVSWQFLEFAPRAIVYHEGSRYVINRSILAVRDDSSGVLTTSVKQCEQCGYLHPQDNFGSQDICTQCGTKLPLPLEHLFRLQNVSTRRRDKINSDEEERQRQGYEIRPDRGPFFSASGWQVRLFYSLCSEW